MTAQTILLFCQDAIHQWDPDAEKRIWRAINSASKKIARAFPWQWLRRSVSLAQLEDATTGQLMPANMIDVMEPIIDTDGYKYERTDSSLLNATPSASGRYFFLDAGAVAPLASGEGVSIDRGSKALSFSPAHGVAACDGEFILLTDTDGQDMGTHEMASASALENTYYGNRINGGNYVIRPAGSRRLSLGDGQGDRIAASATVHYWCYPPAMLAKHQELPDHWEEVMKLAAWLELMTDTVDAKGENVRIMRQRHYDMELARAQQADGKPPMTSIPRDLVGNVRRMGWR